MLRLTVRASNGTVQIVKPGARYIVRRRGPEHKGRWLPEEEPLPGGHTDQFTAAEARLLLPLLRALGTAGRLPGKATSADGKLIDRAKAELGLTGAELAARAGVHPSILSRARRGSLSEAHRAKIVALIDRRRGA